MQLIQLALDAGFPLPDIMVHMRNIYKEKPKKKGRKAKPKVKDEVKTTFAKLPEGTTFGQMGIYDWSNNFRIIAVVI